KKAQYAITKGVQFVQLDLESISEFEEFEIDKKMQQIERLNIGFGLHSETPAFGSREFPHLDSAINQDYRRGHERLIHILKNAAKIKCKYVLVHSSESVPFIFLGRELQPSDLLDPWGNPLKFFIKKYEKIFLQGFRLDQGWIWKQKEMWLDILHDEPEGYLKRLEEQRKLNLQELARRGVAQRKLEDKKREKLFASGKVTPEQYRMKDIYERQALVAEIEISKEEFPEPTELEEREISQEAETVFKQEQFKFVETELQQLWELYLRLMQSKNLSYGPERIAYFFVGKWMEATNDSLWMPIIDITVKYYAKKDKKTVEQWLHDKGIKEKSLDDEAFKKDYRLWVPAVSAKYVQGHFRPEDNPLKSSPPGDYDFKRDNVIAAIEDSDPKKVLDKYGTYFVLETPMAGSGMEDLLRFPQPAQMYFLVKSIDSKWLGIALDIEHMLMDGLNVEDAIDVMPSDSGKWIRVVHTGWPAPLGPAHIPIPLGSEQQYYLYKTYWNLRQKGMGKDPKDEVFIIFERGGGGDPIQQSVLSLRLIKQFLEKDVAPEKLPMEFWGLETGQWSSIDRQLATVREHAWDPLKGLLQLPEEEHGVYSKAAVEKGKAEEWKKEKLR
ncbi:MAG TPA: hypothetical protein VJJ76_03720, partial [archaeon]|nr:hypothetical protein [archaeon]